MGRTNLGATCCLPLAFPLCGSFAVAWIVGGRQGLDNLFFSFAPRGRELRPPVDVPRFVSYCEPTLYPAGFFVFGWRIMIMEAHMFELTESAASNLTAYLTQNRITSPIRVALMQGG